MDSGKKENGKISYRISEPVRKFWIYVDLWFWKKRIKWLKWIFRIESIQYCWQTFTMETDLSTFIWQKKSFYLFFTNLFTSLLIQTRLSQFFSIPGHPQIDTWFPRLMKKPYLKKAKVLGKYVSLCLPMKKIIQQ